MKQVNVKKLILPNIPYVFIALLATKVSEAVRLAPGSDASAKLLNIMTGLNTAFHSLVPSFHPIDLCVGVAAAIAIRLAVYIKGKNAKKFRKNLEYGSARWGTAEDIKPYVDPAFENNIILTQTERLTMNSRPKDPKTARNKNVLIVGGSGSGKTRFWLKPNLLQCTSKTYPTSFVVTDPKGDIVVSCGHALQKNGYQIKILNSLNFKKSMHYNPFAYIHSEKDILKLVTTLIANTKGEGKAGDDFWVKAETLLYTALIGYIHYEAPVEEQNFSTLIEFINAMEVREDDEDFKNPVDLMFDELKKRKPDHFAVRQYAKFKLSAGKTAKSILISCGARLAPFDIQELRELTAYDELQLDTLGDRKTALFIIMSDTDDTFNFLISMCYTQLFNLLCEKADDVYGGRLPVHVRCLIDEAANIGQIPRLEKLVATIRSREISCCLVLQAQSQLKSLYKDSADTIIGNMDCSIFLGGKEPGTLKELAAALGKETIDSYNTGESRGREVSHSLNYQKLGKELPDIIVDELKGTVENYEAFFDALRQESPVPISFEDIPGSAKGFFSPVESRIAIQEGMSEIQTVKTAIHEIAHAKLHAVKPDEKAAPEDKQDRHTKEVEAESVAYTVCQRYGIETSDYSFGYIAGWSSGKETKELKSSLDTIRKTAAEMIEGIDAKLKVLLAEKAQSAEMEVESPVKEAVPEEKPEVPIYRETANYAYEAGELESYRASLAANEECRRAIEAAISSNYGDNRLDADAAVKSVLEQFSPERVRYVLATTIQQKDFDGRIPQPLKEWAKSIDVCPENAFRFLVDQPNPGLTALFVDAFRQQTEAQKEVTSEKTEEKDPEVVAWENDEITSIEVKTVEIKSPVASMPEEAAQAPKAHRLTAEEKEIKAAIMDTLKGQIAYNNDGMRASYRASNHSFNLLARNGVRIDGNTVTQNGEPLFKIHRRHAARKTQGCYRELMPTLEYVKQEQKQEKPSIRDQLRTAAKQQPEQKSPVKSKTHDMEL